MKKNKQDFKELWVIIKNANICIMGVQKKKKEKGTERIFKEIMTKNFSNLVKTLNIQEAQGFQV